MGKEVRQMFTISSHILLQKLRLFMLLFIGLFLVALSVPHPVAIALLFTGVFSLGILGFWLFDQVTSLPG
jgi:hypothetical protein